MKRDKGHMSQLYRNLENVVYDLLDAGELFEEVQRVVNDVHEEFKADNPEGPRNVGPPQPDEDLIG